MLTTELSVFMSALKCLLSGSIISRLFSANLPNNERRMSLYVRSKSARDNCPEFMVKFGSSFKRAKYFFGSILPAITYEDNSLDSKSLDR